MNKLNFYYEVYNKNFKNKTMQLCRSDCLGTGKLNHEGIHNKTETNLVYNQTQTAVVS